jgi:hypothetical protein
VARKVGQNHRTTRDCLASPGSRWTSPVAHVTDLLETTPDNAGRICTMRSVTVAGIVQSARRDALRTARRKETAERNIVEQERRL